MIYLINGVAGVLLIILAMIFRKKKWSKWILLLGLLTIAAALVQWFLS